MSAILHCIVTSIENDRIKRLIANMRFNKKDDDVTNTLNQLKRQLGNICPFAPCFDIHLNDDEELNIFSYIDDACGQDELYDKVQSILNDEFCSGNHITVMHVSWGEYSELFDEWTRKEKILLSQTIP